MSHLLTWDSPVTWTFPDTTTIAHTTFNRRLGQSITRTRDRKGYEFPDDPTLFGEVILRGLAENA